MYTSNTVRLHIACAVAAAALLSPNVTAQAAPRCVEGTFTLNPDGVTNVQGQTRGGQPCEIWFGRYAGLHEHNLSSNPSHGSVGFYQSALTRHYMLYSPRAGFTGRDYFQFGVIFTPMDGKRRHRAQIGVNMTVTP
jgi:hypothetical protein